MFKDVNGFRPTGCLFPSECTEEEIQAKLDALQVTLEEQLAEEQAIDDDLDERFEDWRDDAEAMDGDFDSGMASAGFGTDEDYGCYGDDGW